MKTQALDDYHSRQWKIFVTMTLKGEKPQIEKLHQFIKRKYGPITYAIVRDSDTAASMLNDWFLFCIRQMQADSPIAKEIFRKTLSLPPKRLYRWLRNSIWTFTKNEKGRSKAPEVQHTALDTLKYSQEHAVHPKAEIEYDIEIVKKCIQKLNLPNYKEVTLLELQGFKNDDIAQKLQLTSKQVTQIKYRAKVQLKRMIQALGLTPNYYK